MNRPWPVLLMARELNLGGSERQMAEAAASLDRSEFAPHVGCFYDNGVRGEELRRAGVPVVRFPVRSFGSLSVVDGAWKFRQYVRQHGISLVHTFDVPMNIFGVAAARMARVPVVLSSQRAHRQLTPGLYTRLLRATDRFVDGVVVNCEAMRTHLQQDEGVTPDRIAVCYNSIDTLRFAPPPGGGRAPAPQPGLTGDVVNIGVVCVLRPEKGLHTLLDAFRILHERFPGKVRLTIVGDGPLRDELTRKAAALGIESSCHFAGPAKEVQRWLQWLDIFVLPSLSEALSNSLMEAMACGCCPIASEVGGNPELVRDGDTGLLFPPGNADVLATKLAAVVENTVLRRQLAAAATEHIHRHFTRAESISCLQTIYRRYLKSSHH